MPQNYRFNLREAVYALSDALDFVGIDQLYHGKRVACMAGECARVLGLPQQKVDMLIEAGMLHDLGVSSSRTHKHLIAEMDWNNSQAHCERGRWLLTNCSLLEHLATIVLYHHTHWEDLEAENRINEATEFANIIYMVDRVDALVAQHNSRDRLIAGRDVREEIRDNSGGRFAPHLVDAFLKASSSDAFWLAQEGDHLNGYLRPWLSRGESQEIPFHALRNFSGLFSNIVDAKSPFTAEHSVGVANLARLIAGWFHLEERQQDKLEIAGLLHDLGKLRVPDEILEKQGPLTDEEFMVLHHHSFDSYSILGRINGFEEIARWASDHHETIAGNGYPYGREGDELPIESRILAAADVFQAMAQNRPYRPPMPLPRILEVMSEMVREGHIDPLVFEHIRNQPQLCYDAAVGHEELSQLMAGE